MKEPDHLLERIILAVFAAILIMTAISIILWNMAGL